MFFAINCWGQAGCHQTGGWTQPTGVDFSTKAKSPSLPDEFTWSDFLCFLMLSHKKEISLEKTLYISPLVTGSVKWIGLDLNPASGSVFLTHTMYHDGNPDRRQTWSQLTSASTAFLHRSFRKCQAGYPYNTPLVLGKKHTFLNYIWVSSAFGFGGCWLLLWGKYFALSRGTSHIYYIGQESASWTVVSGCNWA